MAAGTPHGQSPAGGNAEEGRALLQSRVALYWKVIFFLGVMGSVVGALGLGVARPGVDFWLTVASSVNAGIWWWVSSRGKRSVRFSRRVETGGLLIYMTLGAFLSRFLFVGFARDHSLVTAEGLLMGDGYISMVHVAATAMIVAIRAALIPSQPRRTLLLTAMLGLPPMLVMTAFVPNATGGLAWRGQHSAAYPWMPANAVIMWAVALVTCTVISRVIYGLRVEVREARSLGQYVLERKLGEGGMGEVYRARHGMMRRPTAIKLLRGDRAGEINVRRFEREVQLTARLTHPNTITIFDYGRTDDGVFYYAMELLDGGTLQRIVAVDGAQPAGRVVRILGMICGALTEAHAIGLIHRDIKPANIMLCTQGGERDVVKLLDFGLVKEFEVGGDLQLTGTSAVVGTPQYMAPESIVAPNSVDLRADIYALGAVAYYLLAGAEVFDGKSVLEVCGQHVHQQPEPLSARGVAISAELEAVVLACLSKDPARRPQSAAELRRRIEACPAESWDSGDAQTWWAKHQPALDRDAAHDSAGDPRTIAVDGAHRSSAGIAA